MSEPSQSLPVIKMDPLAYAEMEKPAEMEEDNIHYLSGKPFFHLVLSKSHVNRPFQFRTPVKFIPLLPSARVPVILRHGGKNWNMSYIGNCGFPRFDSNWKTFVLENDLKIGDACVFELMECSSTNLRFKVHVLRGDLPPELLAKVNSRGKTQDAPIVLD
ncbi:B3 domain-containing protein [Forsythia ovata]|uniref:B3 domain-containing protein n=1 Tax=Forsythia ovata TaxID=205694 RepID=A0ABD1QQF0_9LAMI